MLYINFDTLPIEFCPVDCDWEKEMMCPGDWDPKSGQQIMADYCIPNKNGDCPASCPIKCGENDQVCPGPKGEDGCQIMADYCFPAKENCPDNTTPECKDNWSANKCQKKKNKCGKKKVAKNCKQTCGKC